MSFFRNMIGHGERERRFEWNVNEFGEIVIYQLDKDGRRATFCASMDGKELLLDLLWVHDTVTPSVYLGRESATWDDVLEAMNNPKRNATKTKVEIAHRVVNRLGFTSPIVYSYEENAYILRKVTK